MTSKQKDRTMIGASREEEDALVENAREGDTDAFGGLVELFQDRVYNLAFRLTGRRERAWDLSQEAFMRAYAAIGSFKGGSRFYTWIYRIMLNLHMNQEHSMAGRLEKSSISMDRPLGDDHRSTLREGLAQKKEGNPADEAMRLEREQAVQEAISCLAPDHRQVVLLRDMEGLSYEEISESIGFPVGTVRSRLHRAREELKRRLEKMV